MENKEDKKSLTHESDVNQLSPGDLIAARDIMQDGYEFVSFYLKNIKNQKKDKITVLDIGAHRGWFSHYVINQVGHNCAEGIDLNIVAIEANRDNFDLMQDNNIKHSQGITCIYGIACGENSELPEFYYENTGHTSGNIYPTSTASQKAAQAKLEHNKKKNTKKNKLGKFAKQMMPNDLKKVVISKIVEELGHVDFMKVDCEGCEYEIIDDLIESGTIKKVETIAMELHGDEEHGKSLVKKLEKNYMS